MKEEQTSPLEGATPNPQPATKGRPRNEQSHKETLDATRYLASTCRTWGEITMEAISKKAGVAKTTIYRWWKTKNDLVMEACMDGLLSHPHTGTLQGDLQEIIWQNVRLFRDSMTRGAFAGFVTDYIELHHIPGGSAEIPKRNLVDILDQVLESARQRGEDISQLNSTNLADHIEMVLYYKCIIRGEAITQEVADALYKHMLSANFLTLPKHLDSNLQTP